ncbi:hypothetical protein J659_2163 [Acinetobacter baumannii 1406589]|uniref:hypothetical protein n=1 Tax=Acinetobacter baumannii TaxID=470 RepID=UPI000452167C|nr:hypothetical protein [Acinetobacter baumannii]EXH25754.1 hypothetical protein J643_2434 [Acinetobacter baumannii 1237893]EXI08246.1 hypothetical protein J644_1394 [Acinetobacter baumannii 480175]EXS58911.1 hypothetical protein J659_2163 [Acinetobacter baumannii 1406589]KCX05164.1 hypothetical protein J990_3576 [Acinetobacter baumannii 45075_4]
MTDLNKEREAFLNAFQYYKGRRDIIFSHEHELFMTRSNNPSEVAQKEISNMNSRWDAWLRCAKHRDAELEKAKAQSVPEKQSVTLTCAELKEAFDFGAPDGEKDQFQMETEMTIKWLEDGYDGPGYYCWYADLPEEGCIKLGESASGAEG